MIDGSVFFAGERGLGVAAATSDKAGSRFTASAAFGASPDGTDVPPAARGVELGEGSCLMLGRNLGADAQACDLRPLAAWMTDVGWLIALLPCAISEAINGIEFFRGFGVSGPLKPSDTALPT